jgi:hypothetical protein
MVLQLGIVKEMIFESGGPLACMVLLELNHYTNANIKNKTATFSHKKNTGPE